MVNNNYDDGFRHLTLFGETDEQIEKVNQVLKDNGIEFIETRDGLEVAVREFIYSNPRSNELKTYMTRLSEKEAEELSNSMIDRIATNISDDIGTSTLNIIDNILEGK